MAHAMRSSTCQPGSMPSVYTAVAVAAISPAIGPCHFGAIRRPYHGGA